MQLANHRDKVCAISAEATQEAALEGMLRKVQDKWMGVELTVKQYKEAKDAYILGSLEEVQAVLEDSLALMATVLSSRFVSGVWHKPGWCHVCDRNPVAFQTCWFGAMCVIGILLHVRHVSDQKKMVKKK